MIILTTGLCLLGALGPILETSSTPDDGITAEQYSVVLNLSGRQRMLTQKMSKEFLLVAAGVETPKSRESLEGTMSLFETTLKGLRDGDASVGLPATPNSRVIKQLDKVLGLYKEIQPALQDVAGGSTPTSGQVATVAEHNLPVLSNMNKAVKMYERESRDVLSGAGELGVIINLAGKQRMLTQKMSKEFMLVYLSIDTEDNRLNLRETTSLFDQTLKGLLDGNEDLGLPGTKDKGIRKQLGVVADLWKEFRPVVRGGCDDSVTPTKSDAEQVATLNMPLLKEMNAAVKMYELLGKQVSSGPNAK